MSPQSTRSHWETIYQTKRPDQVSWTQPRPATSLSIIEKLGLPRSAAILDVGGGDSKLVDYLLDDGYSDISVLDISGRALDRAKSSLGKSAQRVTWIESDIRDFHPQKSYALWHDRAAFHFLISPSHVSAYLAIAKKAIQKHGFLVLGTFSTSGPEKCSGLTVSRYDSKTLAPILGREFSIVENFTEDHTTPSGTRQNFFFCVCRREPDN